MQIKNHNDIHLTLDTNLYIYIFKYKITNVDEMVQEYHSHIPGGNIMYATKMVQQPLLETSLAVPQKLKHIIIIRPSNS